MPRIRYLKPKLEDIQPIVIEESVVDSNDEEIESEPATEQPFGRLTASTGEATSFAGWLSNANVIASLPDAKLRGAIDYHRAVLNQLQAEMVSRLAGRRTPGVSYRQSDIGSFHAVSGDVRRKPRRAAPRRNKNAAGARRVGAVRLTTEQILTCLQQLHQLRKTKTNEPCNQTNRE